MLYSPCFAAEGRVYKEEYEDFQPHSRKTNEEASVTQLTTVRGKHHGPTVVLAGTNFLLLSCSMGITPHSHPWRVKIHLNESQILG